MKKFPEVILEVRGLGLMLGIKFSEKIDNLEMTKKLIDQGLLMVPAGDNVIRILPPLIIDSSHVKEGLEKIEKALNL